MTLFGLEVQILPTLSTLKISFFMRNLRKESCNVTLEHNTSIYNIKIVRSTILFVSVSLFPKFCHLGPVWCWSSALRHLSLLGVVCQILPWLNQHIRRVIYCQLDIQLQVFWSKIPQSFSPWRTLHQPHPRRLMILPQDLSEPRDKFCLNSRKMAMNFLNHQLGRRYDHHDFDLLRDCWSWRQWTPWC